MYVKKRMSLLLFAALAMVLFTACGRWDFSREAAKAANEAQGETLRVEFTVEQKFTNALRAALEENIQPADVEKAMRADESIKPFLTSGYRLDVYPLRADISAKDAAKQLAAEFVNRLAGCEDKGYISMDKADNGYFYEAVLTYRHSSSGGSSGGASGGDNDSDAPVVPDDDEVTVTVTTSGGSENVTVTGGNQTVEKGTNVSFTFTRDFYDKLTSVKVNGDEIFDTTNKDRFSVSYANDMDHTYTFTLKNVQEDTTIAIGFEKATPLTDEASLVHTGTTTAVANPMPCAVGPFILENLDVRIPLNNSNNWGDSGDWLVYNLPNGQGVESAKVEPENINGDTDKVEIRVKINSPNAGVNQEFTFTYGVTVNPTKSNYGESSYLTTGDFNTLYESFRLQVTKLLEGKTLGTDTTIQTAMNNADNVSGINQSLTKLAEEGKIESTSSKKFYGPVVFKGKDVDELTKSLGDLYNKVPLMGEGYDSVYMTVKDGTKGAECYVYFINEVETN